MSNALYVLKKARFGYTLGDGTLIDLMTHDGLTSTFDNKHMVEQASFVSRELGISREEQDEWALRSHRRAVKAQDEGFFEGEIVPVGEVAADEGPRRDTSIERLAALKPVFDPEGTVTAGNAPAVNDGAGCLLVADEAWARERGLEVLATIVATAAVADEFAWLARTPARAAGRAPRAAVLPLSLPGLSEGPMSLGLAPGQRRKGGSRRPLWAGRSGDAPHDRRPP